MEKKTLWVAYTNTDCNEGRGVDTPIAVCEIETTAIRLAKGQYIQGSNGPVRPIEVFESDGRLYVPYGAVVVWSPNDEDIRLQKQLNIRRAAVEKAKAAGLTDEDIAALHTGVTK